MALIDYSHHVSLISSLNSLRKDSFCQRHTLLKCLFFIYILFLHPSVYLGMSLDSEAKGNWSQPGVHNILDLSNTLLLEDKVGRGLDSHLERPVSVFCGTVLLHCDKLFLL